MSHRMDALLSLLRRYVQVFRAAWVERQNLEPVKRTQDELAFLPAHLELTDTPLSPAPRRSMWIIMGLFGAALLWACFGKLDIVAVAPGKTVTTGRTKTIQSLETAVVRRILVHDGQAVKKGDLLVELDAEGVATDATKASEALIDARLVDLRSAALLKAMSSGQEPQMDSPASLPASRVRLAQQQAIAEFSTYLAKKTSLQAAVAQKEAELRTTDALIAPLQQFAEIAKARVEDYRKLLATHYVSRQEYLIREQERITAERDVDGQRHHRDELVAALSAARAELTAALADTRQQLLDQQRQARAQIEQSKPDVQRTSQRGNFMQLRAPVEGYVQQLTVHTLDGVVTPGQPLMSIVPADESIEVQAAVLDKDIGFVKKGQQVVIKLNSFPYARYGYLTGKLVSISQDAAQDEKLGLTFPVQISLSKEYMNVTGTQLKITSGMGVTAEIKTGRRQVIDYLLSPIKVYADESMRER